MNLLFRNVITRSNGLTRVAPNLGFSLSELHKCFSSGTGEEQPPATTSVQESELDSILQSSDKGFVYGRLLGIGKHTLKTDAINLLERRDVLPEDIKVEYDFQFNPLSMIVKFPTKSAFDSALRTVIRKRLYRLDMVDRGMWNRPPSYEGKVVLFQGLPRNVFQDDLERVLSGFDYDSSNIRVFFRNPAPGKLALVQFPSEREAKNVVLQRNRGFINTERFSMRVLQ